MASNQNRSRGGRNQTPQPEPTIKDKILGFLGLGKEPEPPKRTETSRSSGPDRSTGAQARKRVEKSQQKSRPKSKQPRERAEVTNARLHIGNLNYDATGEDLSGLFKDAGTVVSAEVVTNPHSGRSKGFAFVEMSSIDEAKQVSEKFHGQDLMGRDLVISGAKSKGPRESDGPRDRGRGRDRGGRRDDRRSGRESGGRGESESGGRESEESRPPRERKSRAERASRSRGGSPPEGVERFDQAPKAVNVEKVNSAHLSVENLDPAILEGDIKGLFGGIASIIAFEIDGGTATIEVSSLDEAQRAVEVLNGKQFMGRKLKVSGAEGKESSAPAADAPSSDEAPPAEESAPEPEATEPEAAEPEATEPEAAEPEATEPEATEPEATEPEAAEPEAAEPEAAEPEAAEPEAAEPEAAEPEATEPEAVEPEATEPEATEPEATEPEATEERTD